MIAHYGEERDLICTEEEREIYDNLYRLIEESEYDTSPLRLVRVSENYVTAKYYEWDLVRMKYTTRAKWLVFPTAEAAAPKNRITSPDDIKDYVDLIMKSIEVIMRYE